MKKIARFSLAARTPDAPSAQSRILYRVLRKAGLRAIFDQALDSGRSDQGGTSRPPCLMRWRLEVGEMSVDGRRVFTVQPRGGARAGAATVMYLHGGAYLFGFKSMHWKFISTLVRRTGCAVVAPDYPLAPGGTADDAFRMLRPLYRGLALRGTSSPILMGDSSGGGLALALAQQVRDDGLPVPSGVIMLSPWLDLCLEHPGVAGLQAADPILDAAGLRRAGLAYAGARDPRHPWLSPVNGSLAGLRGLAAFIGGRDIFLPDVRRLADRARAEGVGLDCREYPEMVHVWPFFGLPESRRAIDAIVAMIPAK